MPTPNPSSCRAQSRALGVPLAGSAVAETAVWIVLEHRGAWPAKAVRDGALPDAIKARLASFESAIKGSRVQLVRRHGRRVEPLRFWLGVSGLGQCRLWEWSLASVEELLDLDVPALVEAIGRGEAIEGASQPTMPMMLVCTNGRRDRCCSIEGVPVANALMQHAGIDVWHTTHLGGHRFAATLLQLPEGLCYGWLKPEDAPGLADAATNGEVYALDKLRGRTALTTAAQAAETLWRQRTGEVRTSALAEVAVQEHDDRTVVTLRDDRGAAHEVAVHRRMLGETVSLSCGKEPEPVGGWFAVDSIRSR